MSRVQPPPTDDSTAPATPQGASDDKIIYRIIETGRTVRELLRVLGGVACVWLITDAAIQIADKLVMVYIVSASLLMIVAPLSLLWFHRRKTSRVTARLTDRIAELEQCADAGRTSSGLTREGGNPKGDHL
jgi:hypothetical protein